VRRRPECKPGSVLFRLNYLAIRRTFLCRHGSTDYRCAQNENENENENVVHTHCQQSPVSKEVSLCLLSYKKVDFRVSVFITNKKFISLFGVL
jgi:hypothetical protein